MKQFTLTMIALSLLVFAGCKPRGNQPQTPEEEPVQAMTEETKKPEKSVLERLLEQQEPVFEIKTTEGTITVKLYSATPLHKENFCKLATSKFYDGILFHRIIKGFMIQTGDPGTKDSTKIETWGKGGPGYTIPAEFVDIYSHKKGALAAARLGDNANPEKKSSGSQFYIVHDPEKCVHLNGAYTVFGETIDGFDVIDKIAGTRTMDKDRPVKDIRIISVTPVFSEP